MKMRSALLVLFCLFTAAFRGNSQGYIMPGGITAYGSGPGSSLSVSVIQNPPGRDNTCFLFWPSGTNTFDYGVCLDEGVSVFLVSYNDPISLQPILERRYGSLPRFLEPGIPFYVGFYTGYWTLINGIPVSPRIYRDPVFGWGKFVNQDGTIQMLDSALEYGGAGIYAGTQTIIAVPEPPVLNFTRSGNNLLLWWLMSSLDFALQQTSNLDLVNWTDVTTPPTLNATNFHYEVNVPHPSGRTFYRLASK
jgi:hypothetical protein